jgi:hypothetical protein
MRGLRVAIADGRLGDFAAEFREAQRRGDLPAPT